MARESTRKPTAGQILNATLEEAEEVGWTAVRLRRVADRAGCTLVDIERHYRDLDAIADAWFRWAWQVMLKPPPAGFYDKSVRERLYILIMRWFDALAVHRRVTVQMLNGKLYAGHPHHWAPMIFNLSRTVQWLRDAAGLDRGGRWRQLEEIGLTALFLAAVSRWCRDNSEDQEKTRRFLKAALRRSDKLMSVPSCFTLARRPVKSSD